jgi:hypothetical protein
MPAVSERQRRFMGAELERARSGEKTRTGMSEEKLGHFASKKRRRSGMKGANAADALQGYRRGR